MASINSKRKVCSSKESHMNFKPYEETKRNFIDESPYMKPKYEETKADFPIKSNISKSKMKQHLNFDYNVPLTKIDINDKVQPFYERYSQASSMKFELRDAKSLRIDFFNEFQEVLSKDVIESMFSEDINECFATLIYIDNFIRYQVFNQRNYALLIEWCHLKIIQEEEYDFCSQIILLCYAVSIKMVQLKSEIISKNTIFFILKIIQNYIEKFGNKDWIIINKVHQCILLSGYVELIYTFWLKTYEDEINEKVKGLLKILMKTSKFDVMLIPSEMVKKYEIIKKNEIINEKEEGESIDVHVKEENKDFLIKLSEDNLKLQVFYKDERLPNIKDNYTKEEPSCFYIKESELYYKNEKIDIDNIISRNFNVLELLEIEYKEKPDENLHILSFLLENLKQNNRSSNYSISMLDLFIYLEKFFNNHEIYQKLQSSSLEKFIIALTNRIIYEDYAYLDYAKQEEKVELENTTTSQILEKEFNTKMEIQKLGKPEFVNLLENLFFTIFEKKCIDKIIAVLFQLVINEYKTKVFSQNSYYYLKFLMDLCMPNDEKLLDYDMKCILYYMNLYQTECSEGKFEATVLKKDPVIEVCRVFLTEVTKIVKEKILHDYEIIKEKERGQKFIITYSFILIL